ncbi:hypothetical protein ACHAPG_011609, partial [Botrytis cinerea]
LLNIPPYSTIQEIRRAFLKKAFILHPDRNPGKDTTAAMQDLQCAYQLLQTHINGEEIEPCQDPIKIIIHKWNLQQQAILRKQEREFWIIDQTRKVSSAHLAREADIGNDITMNLEELQIWVSRRYREICEATERELKQGGETLKWKLYLKDLQLEFQGGHYDLRIL